MTVTYRDMLVGRGIPPSEAQLIEDIAVHACTEAMTTLVAVIKRLPEQRQQAVGLVVAGSMMRNHLESVGEELLDVIREARS